MKCSVSIFALPLCAILSVVTAPVWAGDDGFQSGDIMLRARALGIVPDVSNSTVKLQDTTTVGGQVSIDSTAIPEIDLTYFFTPNIAVEAIGGTARLGVRDTNVPFLSGKTIDLGNTWILPPTVTAQWHFFPSNAFNPYVGAGLNYTYFYNVTGSSALGSNNFRLSNAFGAAFQAGFDYNIAGRWYANFDVKKILLRTKAEFLNRAVTTTVDIDPWLIGGGIGYRF